MKYEIKPVTRYALLLDGKEVALFGSKEEAEKIAEQPRPSKRAEFMAHNR